MKQSKIDAAIIECYTRLFKQSEPSGDFAKLMNDATINSEGQKEIPYMDYELGQLDMDNIIDDIIKEFKVPKILRQRFKTTIYLGCSPKTKQIKKEQ